MRLKKKSVNSLPNRINESLTSSISMLLMRMREFWDDVLGVEKLSKFAADSLTSSIKMQSFWRETSLASRNSTSHNSDEIRVILVQDCDRIVTALHNTNQDVAKPANGLPVLANVDQIPSHQLKSSLFS
eukprot:828609-Rhodomonas_salina.1